MGHSYAWLVGLVGMGVGSVITIAVKHMFNV